MPGFDKWGTQTPIELMHQLFCHKFFYDRVKCGVVKDVQKVQFISAMNPTAGAMPLMLPPPVVHLCNEPHRRCNASHAVPPCISSLR